MTPIAFCLNVMGNYESGLDAILDNQTSVLLVPVADNIVWLLVNRFSKNT